MFYLLFVDCCYEPKYASNTCFATLNPSSVRMYPVNKGNSGESNSSVRIRNGRAFDGSANKIWNRAYLGQDLTVEAQINTINILPEAAQFSQYKR